MSNVLSEGKREQVIALGPLGWSLRRIEKTVHIRRETIGGYLKAAGVPVRPPGAWGRRTPAKPANEVITDFGAELTGQNAAGTSPLPGRSPSSSACEPWREVIELGLSRGRNAKAIWQDLVDDHGSTCGYQSVRRFVGKLRDRHTIIRNEALTARALPSRSRDLPLSARMGAKGGCAPPFIPAADRRSGRIPAHPYPPIR